MPTVWLSRPAARAQALAQQLTALGLTPLIHPAMDITAPANNESVERYLRQVERFAVSIFVSAEAARRIGEQLPAGETLPAVAIGHKTAAALAQRYRLLLPEEDTSPAAQTITDSDYMLTRPLLQKPMGNIAILGGSDSNGTPPAPVLLQTLRKRGNDVLAVSCYLRLPAANSDTLAAAGQRGDIDAAIAYSGDSLRYMMQITAPDNDWLRALPLFVIHPNIAAAARQLDFQDITVAVDNTIADVLRQRLIVG